MHVHLRWISFAAAISALGGLSTATDSPGALPRAPAPAELALAWPAPGKEPPDAWPGTFEVANRGASPSGPIRLVLRTPLGTTASRELTADLLPGRTVSGSLPVTLEPGISAVCLEVLSAPSSRIARELDLADNRVCRRPGGQVRPTHPPAIDSTEDRP